MQGAEWKAPWNEMRIPPEILGSSSLAWRRRCSNKWEEIVVRVVAGAAFCSRRRVTSKALKSSTPALGEDQHTCEAAPVRLISRRQVFGRTTSGIHGHLAITPDRSGCEKMRAAALKKNTWNQCYFRDLRDSQTFRYFPRAKFREGISA